MQKGRARKLSGLQTLGIVAGAIVIAGCSSAASSPSGVSAVIGNTADARVAVGVLADPTVIDRVRGAAAVAIADARTAGALAVDVQIVAAGGDGSPDRVRDAAHAIARRGDIVAVIAAVSEPALDQIVHVLGDANGPLIVNTTVTSMHAASDRVVRVIPNDRFAGETAGRFVADTLRARMPGALTATAPRAWTLIEGFRAGATRHGTAMPDVESYPFAAGGGDPLIALAAKNVDAVFVAVPPRQIAGALRFAPLKGLNATFVMPSEWAEVDARALATATGVTCYVIAPIAFDADDRGRALGARLKRDAGADDVVAAMAYDGMRAVIAAIAVADSVVDPAAVGRALREVSSVPGVTGRFSIVGGEAVRKMVVRRITASEDVFEDWISP